MRRAPGLRRTHSSSREIVRCRAESFFSSTASRCLLLLEPRRVVALVRDAAAAVELEDPAGHVVEEVAVVGDRDDGALVVVQVALEPRDRLGVEVVGGLVEQQQVGLLEEQPAERDAAALAAGERGHVGVAGRQAQRVHRLVDALVEAPRVGGVDPLLDARELVGGLLGVVGGQLLEAVEQAAHLRRVPPPRSRARPCRGSGAAPARAARRSRRARAGPRRRSPCRCPRGCAAASTCRRRCSRARRSSRPGAARSRCSRAPPCPAGSAS